MTRKPLRIVLYGTLCWLFFSASILTSISAEDLALHPRQPQSFPGQEHAATAYIIEFVDPPLARYSDPLPGISLAARLPDGRIAVHSPAASAYVAYLSERQNSFLSAAKTILGRTPDTTFRFQHAFNGMVLNIDKNESDSLNALPGVKHIHPVINHRLLSDTGPGLIGAPGLWDGSATGGLAGSRGEGIVVAALDSGINADHPSFAAVNGSYTHSNPLGSGNYLGYCASNPTFCNAKLIGAYDFVYALVASDPTAAEEPAPEDNDGHGSHTASTMAGNEITVPFQGLMVPISGVAPRANIIAFDICFRSIATGLGLCPNAASLAAVDRAVADGLVNVINFSISGGSDPYNDPVSQALLNATAAGIFVSASAGNAGPGANTLSHHEPWVASVAAASHGREFINDIEVTAPSPVPVALQAIRAREGSGPRLATNLIGIVQYAGDIDPTNAEACNPFPADALLGRIALIARGTCSFSLKIAQLEAAGAIGAVVQNDVPGEPIIMANLESTSIPSLMIGQNDGFALAGFITANPNTTLRMGPVFRNVAGTPDIVASFSSRGPNAAFDLIKPDIMAPGVNVLAAIATDGGSTPPEAGLISGTSMASPHNAGAAALLKSLHPTWSPTEIKSALAMTAKSTGNFKEDGVTPADPFDNGNGRIDLSRAARTGLTMDESIANYVAANPQPPMVGNPRTLNVPSLMDSRCFPTCSWTRSVTNVSGRVATWTTSTAASEGVAVSVTPSEFTLGVGRTQALSIVANTSLAPVEQWAFGSVTMSPNDTALAENRLSLAVMPINLTADDAGLFAKEAPSAVGTAEPFTYRFDALNLDFPGTIDFIDILPPDVAFIPGSATVAIANGLQTAPLAHSAGTVSWSGTLDLPAFALTPTTAPFGYVNLAGLGVQPQLCSTICDDFFLSFLGLPAFTYNGTQYDALVVSTNGFAIPGTNTTNAFSPTNQNLPDASTPNNVLAPFWTDLDLNGTDEGDSGDGQIYVATVVSGANEALIVEWADVERFGTPGVGYRFQLQIYTDASTSQGIYFSYAVVPATDFPLTVGAEADNGEAGTSLFFHDGMSATGIPPAPANAFQLAIAAAGRVGISFDVRAPTLEVALTNTAQISDPATTLQATAITAVSTTLDRVFSDGFE